MLKRLFDIVLVLLTSPLWLLLFLGITVTIRFKLGNPVLFCQVRPGLNGKPFKIYKFRTMLNAIDEFGLALPDAQRMTKLGIFLRTSSLDELPELFNVLLGDMSLVGPRPLLMEYLPMYSSEQSRRHEMRPGITGWAQINGRNNVNWIERFQLDVWYVDNHSIGLDIRILWITIAKVFKHEGINEVGQATMRKFDGNNT